MTLSFFAGIVSQIPIPVSFGALAIAFLGFLVVAFNNMA
jgi:hypothetical protein